MNIQFPFKNLTVNSLLDFAKSEGIKTWISEKEGEGFSYNDKTAFENDIERYREWFPSFENELLQVANTTNQVTIDLYFEELKGNCEYIASEIDLDTLNSVISQMNEAEITSFNVAITKKESEYFDSDDRKRANLEVYKKYVPRGFALFSHNSKDWEYVDVVNHNFYCVEEKLKIINPELIPEYYSVISSLAEEFLIIAHAKIKEYDEGLIKSSVEKIITNKPVLFVEGPLDILYIKKAAEILGKSGLLELIEIRHRQGISGLDALWKILNSGSWETIVQKKLLLYDCDASKPAQNDNSGFVFRRTMTVKQGRMIEKGIENLFPDSLIRRAEAFKVDFIDEVHSRQRIRGVRSENISYVINKDEKTNICDWICKNAESNDFADFEQIIQMIETLLL